MSSTHVNFACGIISLEGELHLPEGKGPFPCVVVCHPHPLYGGNMLNNIVTAICEVLPQQLIAALRFNFRGVGKSGGSFGGGIAEQDDVRAALDFLQLRTDIDARRIGLAGYSFGGRVALPVALHDERVSLLSLVSPALSDSDWEQLKEYSKPKFIIVGDADFVIQLELFQQYIKDVPANEHEVVSGADHFWWGYEDRVAQKVSQFFKAGFEKGG